MRPLRGFGNDGHLGHLEEPPVIGEAILGPRPLHDLHRLVEALAALLLRHAVPAELGGAIAAPHPDVEAAIRDDIHQRHLLGEPERVVKGQDGRGEADANAPGARGGGGGEGGRIDGETVVDEVVLGEPDLVEAQLSDHACACRVTRITVVRAGASEVRASESTKVPKWHRMELGFDEIWLTEHHFIDYGLSVDPAALAAAAASRTRRIRIGLAAAILPFHHPLRLAEQMALVDIISNGRLDVGVGRGNRPAEFRGYRVPQEESRERFDEAVEIMQRAWTEDRFSYDGRFFQVPEVSVIPKPTQRPHPPLYQVCVTKDGIENTALRGWPMLNSVLFGPVGQLVANRDTYVEALKKSGRSPEEIAGLLSRWGVSRQIYVAETDATALAEAKDAELWYQESFRQVRPPPIAFRMRIHRCSPASAPWKSAWPGSPGRASWPRPSPSARPTP